MTLYRVTGRAPEARVSPWTAVPDTVGVGGTVDLSLSSDDETLLVSAGVLRRVVPAIASAGTIAMPNDTTYALVTGGAAITTITAGQVGARVTLSFDGTATVTDGDNLRLAEDLTATAYDSITLVCDGTDWIEEARSVN